MSAESDRKLTPRAYTASANKETAEIERYLAGLELWVSQAREGTDHTLDLLRAIRLLARLMASQAENR